MAVYSLVLKASAVREIEALPTKGDRQRVVARIRALAEEPRPLGSEKLAGSFDRYRLRQGRYRILYTVDDDGGAIVVFKAAHRRDVYR